MDEKEPIKIRLSTVILLFIIFILIIAMIFMYFYFTNSNKENTNIIENTVESTSENEFSNSLNTEDSIQEDTNATSTIKKIDINSSEVQQLYKYIMKVNPSQEELVYRNTKVTEKDLNNQLKLATVFENITRNDASKIKNVTDSYGSTTEHVYYSKNTIENMTKKIFGNTASIKHETYEGLLAQAKEYKNGEYDCYEYQGGGGYLWILSCSDLINAEQNGDEIYIYDRYVHIFENDVSGNSCTIYDSSDKSNIIATNVDSNTFLKNAKTTTDEYSSKVIIDNLNTITNNKIKTFKHTFKKNTNGSYYWYSTEPVN